MVKNPLRKRHLRELRSDFGKYLVIFLLLVLSIAEISGFLVADISMIAAYEESFEKYQIENGHFTAEKRLSARQHEAVEKLGVRLYELFYTDRRLTNGSKLRIFKNRRDVNLACTMQGRLPEKPGEIAVDRMYADNNGLRPGDQLCLEATGEVFTISGLVALSDYSTMFENNSDMMFDAKQFGVAVVSDSDFQTFDTDLLQYCYAWKYKTEPLDETAENSRSEEFSDALHGIVSLSAYCPSYQNQAIRFTGKDMGGDRAMMTIFLVAVNVIIAFVFAVTVSSTITKESTVIGTLRASGYRKSELIRHYMTLPVLVTLSAALLGNILGYTVMKNVNANLYYGSYSLPTYETRWSTEALIETTLIPIVSMLVVNLSVLSWKLRLSPLKFLRRDLKKYRSRGVVRLSRKIPFFSRFRLRIIFQNMSSYLLLAAGILFANFLLLFGLMFPSVLKNYTEALPDNMLSSHQYILKLPENAVDRDHQLESLLQMMLFKKATETDNESAEKFSAWSLDTVTEPGMKDEEILLYGISEDSRYVDLDFAGSEVYVSQSLAEKRLISEGDTLKLKEKYDGDLYEFEVAGIYPYSGALCVFMSQEALNERFELGKDAYSGYFSDTEITDIDEKYIGQRVDFETLSKVSRQLEISMGSMMGILDVFAILMYVILIYLISKTIIEKNAAAISMSKILGFTNRELGRLYVLVTSLVVVVLMAGSIPIEVFLLTTVFRIMIRVRMTGWIPFILSGDVYVKMLAFGLCSYAVVAVFEYRRISRIPKTEALKNVE